MSLNRKRRIFRPEGAPNRRPTRGVTLTILVGGVVMISGGWLALQPSRAPASLPPPGHVAAAAANIRVLDSATLLLGQSVVRLAGLVVTERGSRCQDAGGAAFDCGVAAANGLAAMVRAGLVDCAMRGTGQNGHPLARCTADGRDINQAMVAAGWSRAEPHDTTLIPIQQRAQAERRGLWAGHWDKP